MKAYQVIQHLEWSCPGMIIWTENYGENEFVTGMQQNPENGLTYQGFEDEQEYIFNPQNYAYVEQIFDLRNSKSSKQMIESYKKFKRDLSEK